MTSTSARFLAALSLVAAAALGCADDGGGGTGGLPDSSGSVFPDAVPAVDARPDAPAVVPTPDGGGGVPGLACSLDEVMPLFQCAFENCVELPDPAALPDGGGLPSFDLASLGTCAVLECGTLLFELSPSCRTCLLGAFAGGTAGALEGCVSGGLPELPELPGIPTPP